MSFDVITTTSRGRDDDAVPSERTKLDHSTDASKPPQKSHHPSEASDQTSNKADESSLAYPSVEEEPPKPPMSLFKSIFAESSSSSDSEEDQQVATQLPKGNQLDVFSPVDLLKTPDIASVTPKLNFQAPIGRLSSRPVETHLQSEEWPKIAVESVQFTNQSMINDRSEPADSSYGPALPPESTEISLPPTSVVQRHKREKNKKSHRHRYHHRKHDKNKHKHSSKDRKS